MWLKLSHVHILSIFCQLFNRERRVGDVNGVGGPQCVILKLCVYQMFCKVVECRKEQEDIFLKRF